MSTVGIFTAALERIRAVFPTAVVEFRNGSYSCNAIRSNRANESIIDPNTGRVDPDRFSVRVQVSECGPISGGITVLVGEEACSVEDVIPDSIGLSLLLNLRRKKVAP